jgi:hypothetical protein
MERCSCLTSIYFHPHLSSCFFGFICNKFIMFTFMFVPCIIRRSTNNQHYALICTTSLFYILAPTCFGSSLPSSERFLDPSELPEIQIECVVYRVMFGYVPSVVIPSCAGKHNRRNHDTPAHRPRNHTLYITINSICISGNSE